MRMLNIFRQKLKAAPRNVVFAAVLIAVGTIHASILLPAAVRADLDGIGSCEEYVPFIVGAALFMYSLKLGLVWLMILGRNWARIVFIVICMLGIPGFIRAAAGAGEMFSRSFGEGLSIALLASTDYIALFYLLTRASGEWFRKGGMKRNASDTASGYEE